MLGLRRILGRLLERLHRRGSRLHLDDGVDSSTVGSSSPGADSKGASDNSSTLNSGSTAAAVSSSSGVGSGSTTGSSGRTSLAPEADLTLVERHLLSLRRCGDRGFHQRVGDRRFPPDDFVRARVAARPEPSGSKPERDLGAGIPRWRRIGRGDKADRVRRSVADTEAILRRRAVADRRRRVSARDGIAGRGRLECSGRLPFRGLTGAHVLFVAGHHWRLAPGHPQRRADRRSGCGWTVVGHCGH